MKETGAEQHELCVPMLYRSGKRDTYEYMLVYV